MKKYCALMKECYLNIPRLLFIYHCMPHYALIYNGQPILFNEDRWFDMYPEIKKHEMCCHSPEACWLCSNSQLKIPYAQPKCHSVWTPAFTSISALKAANRKISNIKRTKIQNLNVSFLVLPFSLPNPLSQVDNEDLVGAAPTGDAPTTSELSAMILPNKVRLILEVWLYITRTHPDVHIQKCKTECLYTFRPLHPFRLVSAHSNKPIIPVKVDTTCGVAMTYAIYRSVTAECKLIAFASVLPRETISTHC